MRRLSPSVALVVCLCGFGSSPRAASEHAGQVVFGAVPVPGATVTVSQGAARAMTTTNQDGFYRFADLEEGEWLVEIEMTGFERTTGKVTPSSDSPPTTWQLQLRPAEQVATAITTISGDRFSRAEVVPTAAAVAPGDAAVEAAAPDSPFDAADGFLINGSVNNAAASPFAQLAAFGNNRRAGRARYTGGLALVLNDSAWDARPYSVSGRDYSKPSYRDVNIVGNIRGPMRIPGLIRNGPDIFIGVQRTSEHTANTTLAVMPTLRERQGDFSGRSDASAPVEITDPITRLPFQDAVIPGDRISPQAAALLAYYPLPNFAGDPGFNYQTTLETVVRQDAVQARIAQTRSPRTQLGGHLSYQRTRTDSSNIFGFEDQHQLSGVDGAVTWSRRHTRFLTLRAGYQFTQLSREITPYFANRVNVSGVAGIAGNAQDAINWGPPGLTLSSIESLSDGIYTFERDQIHSWNAEAVLIRGQQTLTFGGDVRARRFDVLSQQDPRGSFSFNGYASGHDLSDLVLGLPASRALAYGNADKYLRGGSYDAYVNNDWRPFSGFTLTGGVRWEYESPTTERYGRLTTMARDVSGVQPRAGVAWRPFAASSLIVRAGYGIYRNTNVYLPIALLLAQQPPWSRAFSLDVDPTNPVTLANGFVAAADPATTFDVDHRFKVGFTQNWQFSLQRDLPASLTVLTSYLGIKGSRLLQATIPTTFVHLTSHGRSLRHAAQVQLRRRLHNGLTWTTQYTLAKAMDDAASLSTLTLSSLSIAQDWEHPEAEWSRSSFDQRHQVTAQLQYTTGVGVAGGAFVAGIWGKLLRGWTVTSQLVSGSGSPFTPTYLRAVSGTGVVGPLRPDVIGPPTPARDGLYLNPAAYAAPSSSRGGSAGRYSVTGPAQFSLNAGVTRSFAIGERWNLDWRLDAINVLNQVTFAGVNAVFGNPQFGMANRANNMRKLHTTVRVRF